MIECHFHPADEPLCHDIDGVLSRAREVGVVGFVATGYDQASNEVAVSLAGREPDVCAAVGHHPWFLEQGTLSLERIATLAAGKHVVAVGEIGLDGKIETDMTIQERWFLAQLELARELDLPVVVHSRAAFERTLDCIKQVPGVRGVMHSFGGSPELAAEFIKRGFVISFSGTVTRPRAKRIHRLAQAVPLEAMVIETDAPAIGAEGVPPGTIEPRHLPLVVDALAELRPEPHDTIVQATTANARRIFEL